MSGYHSYSELPSFVVNRNHLLSWQHKPIKGEPQLDSPISKRRGITEILELVYDPVIQQPSIDGYLRRPVLGLGGWRIAKYRADP
jgi:hypothetical protein